MPACQCGSGRMAAGGCASGAGAEGPMQGRGMNEAVCTQVSAGSDAGRTYRWVTYAKARVVSIPFLFLHSHPLVVITGRLLQCITPVMIGKVEKRLQMSDLCP